MGLVRRGFPTSVVASVMDIGEKQKHMLLYSQKFICPTFLLASFLHCSQPVSSAPWLLTAPHWYNTIPMLHILPQSLWVHMGIDSVDLEGLGFVHPLWLLHCSCLLFPGISEPWGKRFHGDISLRDECSKYIISGCECLHLFASLARHAGWARPWSVSIAECDWCPYDERAGHRCSQRRSCANIARRDSDEIDAMSTFILRFLVSRIAGKWMSVVESQGLVLCYHSPTKRIWCRLNDTHSSAKSQLG